LLSLFTSSSISLLYLFLSPILFLLLAYLHRSALRKVNKKKKKGFVVFVFNGFNAFLVAIRQVLLLQL
jgi:hypothetical protein